MSKLETKEISKTYRGRRVVNIQVTAWQENRAAPVATLRGHFVVNGPTPPT